MYHLGFQQFPNGFLRNRYDSSANLMYVQKKIQVYRAVLKLNLKIYKTLNVRDTGWSIMVQIFG